MKLGIIGYGTIASLALETVARELKSPLDSIICCARPEGVERAQAMLDKLGPSIAHERIVTSDIAALIAAEPGMTIEAAGHPAVRSTIVEVLEAGLDYCVTSVGALSDDALAAKVAEAQARGGRLHYLPGAVGGLDILAAAKLSGLDDVLYISRKPPGAWKGTPAESRIDLSNICEATIFYDGPASGAARDFPQNANVAATIALAGAGMAKTRVQLVADPGVTRNVHEVSVRSACADFTLRIEGRPSPDNPKTSLTTAYSLAAFILAQGA